MRRVAAVCLVYCLSLTAPSAVALAGTSAIRASHGLTLFGDLKYGPDFKHFDYADPKALKGGTYNYTLPGGFDSLNAFIVTGTPALGLGFMIYEPLMARSADEPVSVYGLIAESVTVADDYGSVEFTLRKEARWHDGKPITPGDVIFTIETLKAKGSPAFRNNFSGVTKVEKTGQRTVRVSFREAGNRGLPFTIAETLVLPKHYWATHDIAKSTLEPPLGSGPYRIASVDPGREIVFERVRDRWSRDLPVNAGRFNFDRIRQTVYRDIAVQFESFMAGNIDLRWETLPQQWAKGYDVPAVRQGRIVKEVLGFEGATMYGGYYFNSRRDKFKDPRIREAIAYADDFTWTNKTIYHGLYLRTRSYFQNTELAASGVPGGEELKLLEPFRKQLPPRLFAEEYNPPRTDGTPESLRRNLRIAADLLRQAGFQSKGGKLISPATAKPMEIEILLWDPSSLRAVGPFVENLKLLGIAARVRLVDAIENARRMEDFDFDMMLGGTLPQSLAPRAEQREYWGSAAADRKGSLNLMGIENPIVDALIEKIIEAPDRTATVAATRALDRVLQWNFYSIPRYYAPGIQIAYWNRFSRPKKEGRYLRLLSTLDTWWIDPKKDAALKAANPRS